MKHWRIKDVAWDRFDRSAVDARLIPLVKAAAMVERNGTDYALYLGGVFHDDPDFRQAADHWALEEVQHGDALAAWARTGGSGLGLRRRFRSLSRRLHHQDRCRGVSSAALAPAS